MELFLREIVSADRPALRALFVASRDAAFTWAPARTHQLEDFDASTEGERVLVALAGDVPVGFASVWEPDSFLHHLFVHPSWSGRGVGTALLAKCAPYFTKTPTLKCLVANARARAFYVAHGWRVRSEGESVEGPYVLMAARSLGDLLEEEPRRWGLRGDPHLWSAMKERFADVKVPESAAALRTHVERAFLEITGTPMFSAENVYVERLAHGGMSSGMIEPAFWRDVALPMLAERLRET